MAACVTRQVGESLSRLGTNLILVRPGEAGAGARAEAAPFSAADADAIAREVSEAQAVAPVESRPLQAIAGDRNRLTTVTGSTHSLLDVRAWTFANGRGCTDVATAQLARDVARVLRERRRTPRGSDDDFSIRDMTEIASAALGTTRALTRFVA